MVGTHLGEVPSPVAQLETNVQKMENVGLNRDEGSVPPMARSSIHKSPNIKSTAANELPNVARQSGLRTELPNDSVSQETHNVHPAPLLIRRHTDGSNVEANDYMNGGLPHNTHSVSLANGALPGQSLTKPSSPQVLKTMPTPASSTLMSQELTTNGAGTSTPPGRRSVQFAREGPDTEPQSHLRRDSWGGDEGDTNKDRRGLSLMSKLKALATAGALQTHSRSPSGIAATYDEGSPRSPSAERRGTRVPHTLEEEGSDVDADAEETADEDMAHTASRFKGKRRPRRPQKSGSQTAPTTPKSRAVFGDSPSATTSRLPFALTRRVTMPDEIEEHHGLSEGEGRDRLGKQKAWRRGSSWIGSGRGHSFSGPSGEVDAAIPGRKPLNFRRLTGFGPGGSDGEAQTPRRPFLGGGRTSTFGAHGWKTLKHSLKLLAPKKEEHKIDYLKSAELMAELRAGAPAALMLASMILRDEHGNKRIPVLLEQLKLKITDSKTTGDNKETESERHVVFRIELEYGSGMNRMKWVISRSLGDFINLHVRYKLQTSSDKYIQLRSDINSRPKQPHFPRSAFPYARGLRGLAESEEDEAEQIRNDDTAGEVTHSENERPARRKKRHPSLGNIRRRPSTVGLDPTAGALGTAGDVSAANYAKKAYNERQRRKLEQYLQEMIRWLIFRADSNRLCRFLELSALGVRLAAEGSYHGKEGHLVIQISSGLDFRRMLTPRAVFARHSPKWFLVRHSYIVCVDSPENMHIYDVYLLDPKFEIQTKPKKAKESGPLELTKVAKSSTPRQHHGLKLYNSERKLKLLAKNERQLRQFEESIRFMMEISQWSKPNRFDSFAPVRTGVFAQWLVDGRDYMWNVSRAISMAKDVIYIHDWWLSPQLYMRRPAAISQKWRLDRLLKQKAKEGVKIFVIIYRNVEAAVPIDSEYTKFSLLDLHPNIFVQRSPNQFKKNQFFFAHHEKICVVDHTVAFVGGIDLCFGRWDTPQHSVCDDKPTGFELTDEPKDADHCQLWPGKDYSNPRVQDFYQLSEPYAEMYDRSKVPRMPWHDISMQIVGQPARDLTRHFVQRWNYVLRGRKPTRPTPFLLPPPDYVPADLEALGLKGTCEVQILRSACDWSLGIQDTEHSIMNAYCKMIEESEHFVYMENQFFISSSETMGTKITNKIGDALVERAVRAYRNNESWRCIIIIPLMPGFQNTVDAPDGTSIRLIMQCQFRTICRGDRSIFGRLRLEGIEPEEYISFYSLRAWGKIGPRKSLVTEQLYIHAKVIIVDDRTALIGSANINERSMLGDRDSECAAIVRDTDMLWSTMDGEPYLVGRFAHTLRMRLMREHLGIDVDEIMEAERRAELDREEEEFEAKMNSIYNDANSDKELDKAEKARIEHQKEAQIQRITLQEQTRSFNHDADWEQVDNPNLKSSRRGITYDKRITGNKEHAAEVDGAGDDRWKDAKKSGIGRGRDTALIDGGREVLLTDIAPEGRGTLDHPGKAHDRVFSPIVEETSSETGNLNLPPMPKFPRSTTEQLGLTQLSQLPALPVLDDTDIGGPPVQMSPTGKIMELNNPLLADFKPAMFDKDSMRDPLNDSFFDDVWRLVAENNTKIFRRVFRCNPDNEVTNWHEYTEYEAYIERFSQAQSGTKSQTREGQEAKGKSGPPGSGNAIPALGPVGHGLTRASEHAAAHGQGKDDHPLGTVAEWAGNAQAENEARHDTSNVSEGTEKRTNAPDEKVAMEHRLDEATSAPFPSIDQDAIFTSGTNPDPGKVAEKPSNHRATFSEPPEKVVSNATTNSSPPAPQSSGKRRRRATTKSRKGFSASDDLMTREDAELHLSMVQGSLVVFPYDWLKAEEHNSNWLYQVDQVAPLQIYN